MRKFILFIVVCCLALVCSGKSHALYYLHKTDKVNVEIWTPSNEINSKQKFPIVVKFVMKDGWHILANPAGDVGRPTKVDVVLPKGYEQQSVRWSVHKRFETEGIVQFGWDNIAYYKTEIMPVELDADKVELPINIEWQACKDECIPDGFAINQEFQITELNPMQSLDFEKILQEAEDSFVSQNDSLWWILLCAFLGGLILNFMPCVFPILSLKVISLLSGKESARKLRIDALLYLCGVLLSFVVMAGIMWWLRLQGEAVGWGFQLQSPVFVGVILGIFIIVLVMLLDWVKVPVVCADKINKIVARNNYVGAFATGFFAVLIASPCTAPFMGIAVGYTLTQPLMMIFPVFLMIGLGYALPFTLIGFFPRLVAKFMPKSGKWLSILKKIFAIPVFFTCVWLIWILLYQIGDWESKNKELDWAEYDANQISKLVAEGNPVFVNFTAKWCLTCLLNDKAVLSSDEFSQLAKDKKIYLFKADWTNKSEEITKALAQYERNSIPLYIYYDGESAEEIILPQLLTISIIQDYIQ